MTRPTSDHRTPIVDGETGGDGTLCGAHAQKWTVTCAEPESREVRNANSSRPLP